MDRIYNKSALSNAKTLRNNQTDCEYILWQHLRAKRLNGIKFRRQVPIGKYVVDFVNLGKRLVVELDGSQYLQDKNIEYDTIRTEYLNKLNYKVLRFYNKEITNNIDSVLERILKYIMVFDTLSLCERVEFLGECNELRNSGEGCLF